MSISGSSDMSTVVRRRWQSQYDASGAKNR